MSQHHEQQQGGKGNMAKKAPQKMTTGFGNERRKLPQFTKGNTGRVAC